jgi:hypothetical protein
MSHLQNGNPSPICLGIGFGKGYKRVIISCEKRGGFLRDSVKEVKKKCKGKGAGA